ncbi:protein of unknown function [Modestobacter italicus]|uniref:Uncharacterized protein n=1 Tax=Modestobacter italicus (strain DSM 44449 / CECT 9708 / BC 501) TaxID=2732864 RepID=I4F3Q2_MODI5|nr:protein of unknown function [Modestobacter marinus]
MECHGRGNRVFSLRTCVSPGVS